jgi:hypothetical protein
MTFLDSSIFLEHVFHLSGPCVTICTVMPRPCLSQHQCSQIVSCRSVCKKSQSFPPTFLFHIFTIIWACVSIPFWTCRRSPQWLVYKLTASPWGKNREQMQQEEQMNGYECVILSSMSKVYLSERKCSCLLILQLSFLENKHRPRFLVSPPRGLCLFRWV